MGVIFSFTVLCSFIFFLLLFLFIGAIAARISTGSEADYLLGGRGFGKWTVGLSTGASGNSGFILVAAVGLGYSQGLGAFLYVLGFFVGELIFWIFAAARIAEKTDEYESDSVSELLSQRKEGGYSVPLRSATALLTILFIGVYLVAQLVASAKILEALFGLEISTGATITTLLILGYCTTGGLRASVWTDVVQALLIVALTTSVTLLAFSQAGGIELVAQSLFAADPELLTVSLFPVFHQNVLYFIGAVFLGFGFTLSQPHLTVRLMAGRNPKAVRDAKWVYFAFLYLCWGAMTCFGIAARVLLPEIDDPEQALPQFIVANFSPVLIGVALAGMFSTIASTADSQLLACSSALSRDLFPLLGEKMLHRYKSLWLYCITAFVGVIALLFAAAEVASVFDLVIFASSTLTTTLGMVMLIRISRLKFEARAVAICMFTGLAVALLWRFFGLHNILSDAAPGLLTSLGTYTLFLRYSGLVSSNGDINDTQESSATRAETS